MQSAFSRYRSMRAARTTLVTKQSFRIGGMAHTLSPWKARLRNAIFTAVPVSIQERAMSRMLADTPLHAVGGA